jgi:predicted nucleic acid-binding protein
VATLYLDTSALVKLYVREDGTERMLAVAHPDAGHRLTILSLARIEMRAAVRRRSRQGDLSPAEADLLLDRLNLHLAAVLAVQPVNDLVLEQAAAAIDRHALRAYDAVQLGGFFALRIQLGGEFQCKFICADAELAAAARRDGIELVDLLDPTQPL